MSAKQPAPTALMAHEIRPDIGIRCEYNTEQIEPGYHVCTCAALLDTRERPEE